MDLRIIIVSWNNRDELPRCLSSLEAACSDLSYEVIVVDNASTDGTREFLLTDSPTHRLTDFILNADNRGFAAACNQGLAGFDARYALLLNPDTECPPGSLAKLVAEADAHPDGAIFGPKLLDEKRNLQRSVRRFPGVSDQMSIWMKLPHLGIRTPSYRRYMAEDLDPNASQTVDQIMGACFLIKGDFIREVGGLDERYFIWFEEVDYCKQAVAHGKKIWYFPSVEVRHIGGQSFSRTGVVRKQRMIATSMRSYFKKWHTGWGSWMVRMAASLTIAVASVFEPEARSQKPEAGSFIKSFFIGIGVIEILSLLTIFSPMGSSVVAIALTGLIAILAWKKPTLALSILFAELVIGSKGALFQLGGWPGTSVRILMFVAFFIGWMGNVLSANRIKTIAKLIGERWEWIALAILVIYGALRGIALHGQFFFSDVNAWGFLALILPTLDLAERDGKRLLRYGLAALVAGVTWMAIVSLGLEYVFSHGFKHISQPLYLWFRRTGVGEATLIAVNGYRIFIQSFIYCLPAILFSLSLLIFGRATNKQKKILTVVLLSALFGLVIGLSRSMWIGACAGVIALLICFGISIRHFNLQKLGDEVSKLFFVFARVFGIFIASIVILFAVIAFPIPRVDVASLQQLFGSRISTSDAASASRWILLSVVSEKIKEHPILGSGFGASVTYHSKDPRILAKNPTGLYTTYAFEWGWLEHWVKMGVFGLLAVAWLVYSVLRRAWKSQTADWIRYGSVATIIALAVTHIFTPYLNHPLGFGILMAVEGWILMERKSM